jgi:hypothetical protein
VSSVEKQKASEARSEAQPSEGGQAGFAGRSPAKARERVSFVSSVEKQKASEARSEAQPSEGGQAGFAGRSPAKARAEA